MQQAGLKAILRLRPSRSFIPPITDSRHDGPFSPNLLLNLDFPTEPGKVLVGEITYLPLANSEWGYLAAWMDLLSRKIKGWSVAQHMEEELVHSAWRKAIYTNQFHAGSVIHSDRGGQ
jgi:transposase InsO family protein